MKLSATVKEAVADAEVESRRKKQCNRILALPEARPGEVRGRALLRARRAICSFRHVPAHSLVKARSHSGEGRQVCFCATLISWWRFGETRRRSASRHASPESHHPESLLN